MAGGVAGLHYADEGTGENDWRGMIAPEGKTVYDSVFSGLDVRTTCLTFDQMTDWNTPKVRRGSRHGQQSHNPQGQKI